MKILIDASPLLNEFQNRGVGNQVYSTIRELLKNKSHVWQLMAPGTKSELVKALGYETDIELPANFQYYSLSKLDLIGKLSSLYYSKFKVDKVIKKAQPDLILRFQLDRPSLSGVAEITFIPDIIPLQTGVYSRKSPLANNIKRRNYQWLLNRARKSSQIITLSDYSRQQLLQQGFEAEKITVAPLALSSEYAQSVTRLEKLPDIEKEKRRVFNTYNLTEPYICYFGGLEENKNVGSLVTAFAQLVDKYPDLKLVIGGKEFKLGWDHKAIPMNERAHEISNLCDELKISHKVIFTGFVQTQHQPIIYKYARAFVHLSKLEGFGLNVLEPQAVGTPVIASNSSTYPEVLGESAVLVDPDDIPQIASAIASVVGKDEKAEKLRAKLTDAGVENLKRYSWAKTANVIQKVIAKVATETETAKTKAKEIKAAETKAKETKAAKVTESKNTEQKPDRDRKKTAVVIATYFWPFRGGMEQVAMDYAKFLVESGYETYVLTSDRKEGNIVVKTEEEINQGLAAGQKITIKRLTRKGKNYYFYYLKGLYQELKNIKPEIIHLHGFGFIWHDICVGVYKYLNRKSIKPIAINTPHGPFMSKEETGLRAVVKSVFTFLQSLYLNKLLDSAFAVNTEQHEWINRSYRISKSKIMLQPPVIQPAAMPKEKLFELKDNKDHILISCISRFAEYKGFDDLISAFEQINSTIPTKLYLAGSDSEYRKTLEKQVNNSSRREDITLEVDITDETRDNMLAKTDIFVFASAWEAFGIVLAEAMTHGAAIVSSNTEGGRFMRQSGAGVDLFEYRDLKTLISRIDAYLNDKKLLKTRRQDVLKVAKQFSEETLGTKFIETIMKLIKTS